MTCHKCQGLMIEEPSLHHRATESLLDQFDVSGLCAQSYHCLSCGNYEDGVIVANRRRQAESRRVVQQAETIATWADVTLAKAVRA